jgi:hypothetical protein
MYSHLASGDIAWTTLVSNDVTVLSIGMHGADDVAGNIFQVKIHVL